MHNSTSVRGQWVEDKKAGMRLFHSRQQIWLQRAIMQRPMLTRLGDTFSLKEAIAQRPKPDIVRVRPNSVIQYKVPRDIWLVRSQI